MGRVDNPFATDCLSAGAIGNDDACRFPFFVYQQVGNVTAVQEINIVID